MKDFAFQPTKTDALLVIDLLNDFIRGSLPVADGAAVIPLANTIAAQFDNVVLVQDWHARGHHSFSSTHGVPEFTVVDLPYGPQRTWPDHAVQGSHGADFHKDLDIPHARLVIRKGVNFEIDSYSAFLEADRVTTTGLEAWLKAHGIQRVVVLGLATDYCVGWTAIDSAQAGFETYVVEDACRGIDIDGSVAKAWIDMVAAGVRRTQSHLIGQGADGVMEPVGRSVHGVIA